MSDDSEHDDNKIPAGTGSQVSIVAGCIIALLLIYGRYPIIMTLFNLTRDKITNQNIFRRSVASV